MMAWESEEQTVHRTASPFLPYTSSTLPHELHRASYITFITAMFL